MPSKKTIETETEVSEIDYEIKHEYLPNEPVYYEKITQQGSEGEKVTYTCTPYVNGEQVGDIITEEKITKQPVTKIIQEGTGGN